MIFAREIKLVECTNSPVKRVVSLRAQQKRKKGIGFQWLSSGQEMSRKYCLAFLVSLWCHLSLSNAQNLIITTIAGTGSGGFLADGILATNSTLSDPFGVFVDPQGNIFVADAVNARIRIINPLGVINTFAGIGTSGFTGDSGPANASRIAGPLDVTGDEAGNIYIADSNNHRIRRVASNRAISTFAGTGVGVFSADNILATASSLNFPSGVAIESNGNVLIADSSNNRVRRVTVVTGLINTLTGDGSPLSSGDGGIAGLARINFPIAVAVDPTGNIYVVESNSHKIRKISLGIITTVAGNGTQGFFGDLGNATSAMLNFPIGLAIDQQGNLYIGDSKNFRVRIVSPSGIINTFIGNGTSVGSGDGGPPALATVKEPAHLFIDAQGSLYIPDKRDQRVRKVFVSSSTTQAPAATTAATTGIVQDSITLTSPPLAGSFIGIIVGGAALFLLIVLVVAIALVSRRRRRNRSNNPPNSTANVPQTIRPESSLQTEYIGLSTELTTNMKPSPSSSPSFKQLTDVQIKEKLGEGHFSVVFKAIWNGTTPVAAKEMKGASPFDDFLNEACTLQGLNHPNIVQFLGVFQKEERIFLVTEYLAGGSLRSFVLDPSNASLSQKDCLLM